MPRYVGDPARDPAEIVADETTIDTYFAGDRANLATRLREHTQADLKPHAQIVEGMLAGDVAWLRAPNGLRFSISDGKQIVTVFVTDAGVFSYFTAQAIWTPQLQEQMARTASPSRRSSSLSSR